MERIIALVVIAGLLVAGAAAIDAQAERVGETREVENRSFTPSAGINKFAESDTDRYYYADSATVYNNSSVVPASGNYTWNEDNGTLTVDSGSYLAGRSSANISFSYSVPEPYQADLVAVLGNGMQAVWPLLWVLVAGAFLAVLRGFA